MEQAVRVRLERLPKIKTRNRHPRHAFKEHAERMREVAGLLDGISSVLAKARPEQLEIDAGTGDSIIITCPKRIAKELIRRKLAEDMEYFNILMGRGK
jgi:hypothetical protein